MTISNYVNETGITEILVDATNAHDLIPQLINRVLNSSNAFVGFDIESHDERRHQGLNDFMAINPKATVYKKPKKLVFDTNRTTVTGFSIYIQGDTADFYFNLAHADVENRIPFEQVLPLLQTIRQHKTWIIHNATYEIGIMKSSLGFEIGPNYICSMQLCVSAYNTDEYSIEAFHQADLGETKKLLPEIAQAFAGIDGKARLGSKQNEVMNKFIGKESHAAFSYNGWVRNLSYGYGLKKAVKSWFGYEQGSFEDCLQGRLNMGHLTGQEVLHYGADDAYWCVRLFERVWQFMNETNPAVVETFLKQENPMAAIWADCWTRGIRVNYEGIEFRLNEARSRMAKLLREFIILLWDFKFNDEPSERLAQKQTSWYIGKPAKSSKNPEDFQPKYLGLRDRFFRLRGAIDRLDTMSDFEVTQLVSGPVSANWAREMKAKNPDLPKIVDCGNLTHYHMARVLFHDLLDMPLVMDKGKVSSDGASRGVLREKADKLATDVKEWLKEFARYKMYADLSDAERLKIAEDKMLNFNADSVHKILDVLSKLADIEQSVKLYLNPYLMLADPETHRLYPTMSSRLNTRRMGCENPNGMQLAKRGESVFVRGFFLPERDDHLLVCVDWSQVELVLIGEDSKDPAFFEAYGQIPYQDLHLGAAASAVRVYHPEFTNSDLRDVGKLVEPELTTFKADFPKLFINPIEHTELDQKGVIKFWRSKAGKISNFGYWYSGSLMTVQPGLGWTNEEMWKATENYRKQFPVAEGWRMRTQLEAKVNGFVHIFDGHRRTRYEATQAWYNAMVAKFAAYNNPAITLFGQKACAAIQRRSGNQVVNAKIQGGCAPLAKLSIIRLNYIIKSEGWKAYFYLSIHDELVYSVHYTQAIVFSNRIKEIMCTFPEFVSWLKLDGTISVGRTLEPYDAKTAPVGQIELDEAPLIEGVLGRDTLDCKLDDNDRERVVEYLMSKMKTVN